MLNNNDKYKNHSREELIDELETLKKKKYGLVWDKKNSQEMLDAFVNWENVPENFTPKQFPVLKEVKNKEIENDKNKPVNLLIEGDNYHSLAVLNFTHQNKVDVIYIDPPYNTGNKDFIFNDKFIDKDDPFRHSKWLSFMEKRLRLSKNLLNRHGVIFISIGEDEVAQLKMVCDETFGEKNFINCLIWKANPRGRAMDKFFATTKEYVLVYAKDSSEVKLTMNSIEDDKKLSKFNLKDEISFYKKGYPLHNGTRDFHIDNRPNLAYSIYYNPKTGEALTKDEKTKGKSGYLLSDKYIDESLKRKGFVRIIPDVNNQTKQRRVWRWGQKKFLKEYKTELIFVNEKSGYYVYQKDRLSTEGAKFEKYKDIIEDIRTDEGGLELEAIFHKKPFNFPKPLRLIKFLIGLVEPKRDLVVLDYFAGSGTTGHAVLELNDLDDGNRHFILCTNDENKICTDVCYPRIKKVIEGYKSFEGDDVSGMDGNLKYLKTDFVGSDSTDKNKRDLVNKSAEMICIKEDIFDLVADGGLDYRIYQKGKKFLGIIFEIDAVANFKKEAEKHKGNFVVYCFSYTEATPEKEFKGLKNKYVLKPIPAVILRIYLEIFKK